MNIIVNVKTLLRRGTRKATAFALAAVTAAGLLAPALPAAQAAMFNDVLPEGDYEFYMDSNNNMGWNILFASQEPGKAILGLDPLSDHQLHETFRVVSRPIPGHPNAVSFHPLHNTSLALNNYLAQKTSGRDVTLHNHDWSKGMDLASIFIPERHADGSWTFASAAAPNLVIDCSGNQRTKVGNHFVLYARNNTSAQRIFARRVGETLAEGDYEFYMDSGNNMGWNILFASRESGKAILGLDPLGDHQSNETFRVISRPIPGHPNAVSIHPLHALDMCLNNNLAQKTSGRPVTLHNHDWSKGMDLASIFIPTRNADGSWTFANAAAPNLVIDCAGNQRTKIGNVFQLYAKNNSTAQNIFARKVKDIPSSGPIPSSGKTLTGSLYKGGGYISCAFDGYDPKNGTYGSKGYRHEGIDFAKASGSALYALDGGKITGLNRSGLSWLAVYDAQRNVTVVYMHLAIDSKLALDQTITEGQQIGTESSRGADAVHTHVEIRPGYHTGAAVSKDTVLVNPEPTPYWAKLGYTIK